jgi:hypothetical protein
MRTEEAAGASAPVAAAGSAGGSGSTKGSDAECNKQRDLALERRR